LKKKREKRTNRQMEEKSSQSVKLSSLKPHFLFNALNSVKCEVISDASDKVDLLDDFAAYLRYILRFSENNNVISAKEIVAFLGSYIRLEEARYDQIRIIFEVETLHFQMEALTLFELIYNAIHHGLGGNAPDGKVWVRIQKGKGEVIIEIEDNGKGISKEAYQKAYEEKRSLFQIKESMENRGGSFHIDTMEKRGSTIYLVIPDTILC
jgi:LytS/YehU family sensor histidine kinase